MTRVQTTLFKIGVATVVIVAVVAAGTGLYVWVSASKASEAFRLDAEAAHRGFVAAAASTKSAQEALAKDQRFTELARSGDLAAIEREFGRKQPPVEPVTQPTR